ncbi:MAG: gamma-glutamyltransferase [Chloroflexota bacterium]|nr:MAG: gamma-glutamyltransferase [Chloroflexota bacterium]
MASSRPPVVAPNGVVAAAHPLAAVSGLRMLLAGGNAIDAAVAVAASLNVVEPYMSGIGGVGLMMITLADGRRRGLDYASHAPAGARFDLYKDDYRKLTIGPLSPLVPGNCGGWLTALETHGTMDRKTVFGPAIEYAEKGWPVTPKNQAFIEGNLPSMDESGKKNFASHGRAPRVGEIITQPELAATFRAVVEGGKDAFYRGPIASAIASDVQRRGGVLTKEDMAANAPIWVDPISTTYREFEIATLPPPCCGIQYLEALNFLEGFDLAAMGHGSADHVHSLAEAIKIAVADRVHYMVRPDYPVAGLLSKAYAAKRHAEIDMSHARSSRGDRWHRYEDPAAIKAGDPNSLKHEQTTSFSVIDRWGNAVTVTQSLGGGFGSGMCLGGTGVFLNNFCFWFDVDPESPNAIGPNRRVAMCLAPGHIYRGGKIALAIGTPGGYGILQTTTQMMTNWMDFGMNTQEAIDGPRFRAVVPPGEDARMFTDEKPMSSTNGAALMIESRFPAETFAELERRGHRIDKLGDWNAAVGGGQGVSIDPDSGARIGGADPRRDGAAVGH